MARLSPAEVQLLLLFALALVLGAEAREKSMKTLSRKKREWILPPVKLWENEDYTNKPYIAKIHSDQDKYAKVEYFLTGPGANKPPFNLFVVDHHSGFVRITGIVDREKYPQFNLSGVAKFTNGTLAEANIPLIVSILDVNDNTPYFEMHSGSIDEASKTGTFVMQIKATDNDQAGTNNSEISYSIISQEPEGAGHMFTIDEKTGKLYVKEPTLDRETVDFYRVVVKGADLGGAPGGLTGTGTVEIKVLDINDNIPTLEQSEYTGSVDENSHDVVVMRLKALDKDLEHTDNWVTVFTIVKGNEDNLFSIESDNNTNEGILKLIKPVDFEEVHNLELALLIKNVAPFVTGESVIMDVGVKVGEGDRPATEVEGGMGKPTDVHGSVATDLEGGLDTVHQGTLRAYLIKIAVNNVPEDAVFVPNTKTVHVSEDPNELPEDGVIAVFTAIDLDTGKPSEDVRYAKAGDPDNWFIIDEDTAEIKLIKQPDSESPFMVNRTYFAKIIAISKGIPSKTATGTIAIVVTDSNDHCPTLTTSHTSLCSDEKTVYVTGFDKDFSPNAAPFTFTIIPDGTQGSWDITVINETSAALHSHENLWPGEYKLKVKVSDAQGLSCPADEVFTVDVCTCVDTKDCGPRAARLATKSTELSAPAIGLLLLALCLLLLIPLLLLFCQCGRPDKLFPEQFRDLPFYAKDHLISYHTEGRGEDKEVPLQSIPIMLRNQKKAEIAPAPNFNTFPSKITGTQEKSTANNEFMQWFLGTSQTKTALDTTYRFFSRGSKYGSACNSRTLDMQYSSYPLEDMALPDTFLKEYYTQKAECAVPVKNSMLEYCFEGQGSSVGSLGCCSLLESDDDLHFLNDLGPKFTTLAEICSPPTPMPKASLTGQIAGTVSTTVSVVEPVLKPKIKQSGERKPTDIETKTSVASTNKSSVSTVYTDFPSLTIPRSKVTSIGDSSNISQIATLSHPAQTVLLQQQPVYCTTSSILQPMQYVVQPQMQNTVLLADAAHVANSPGLYVVSGSQSPSSGLVISAPQGSPSALVVKGIKSSKSSVSPSSAVSPTLLLPVSQGVSQGSVSVESWKMVGPNPDGNYRLVQDESKPGKAERMKPGSSRGILPKGAILVKEAAPPQGALSPAAQGSMFTFLPGQNVAERMGVVEVNSNLGQTWIWEPVNMGLELITIGQPQIGIGHVVTVNPEISQARTWPAGIGPVGMRHVSINQKKALLKETLDCSGVTKEGKIPSPKQDKTINDVDTIIVAETTKTHLPVKEEFVMETLFKAESNQAQNIHNDTVNENQDVKTYTSEQHEKLDDEDPTVVVESAFKDDECIQEYPTQNSAKSLIAYLEEDTVKSLPRPDELQTSFEPCNTVAKNTGNMVDEFVPNHLITEASSSKLTDVITNNSNDPQRNTAEKPVPSENFPKEDISVVNQMTSAEDFLPGYNFTDLPNRSPENEDTLTCPQGKEGTSISGPINTKEDQLHDSSVESVGRYEAAPLKEVQEEGKHVQLRTDEGLEDRHLKVASEPQPNEVTKGQSGWDVIENVSPGNKVVSDLETNEIIPTSVSIQVDENMEEMPAVNTDTHEEVEKQLLGSEVRLSTVVDESSATPPREISNDSVDEPEERSMPVQEKMPEPPVNHSEGEEIDKWQRQTAAEAGDESFTPISTVAGEAFSLVQNERVHNTGEVEEMGPTVGKAGSINVESNIPYTVEDQIHGSSEESVDRSEVAPLKEGQGEEKPVQLSIDEGLEDTHFKPVSEPQPNEVPKGQSGWDVDENVSPGNKVVSDLETNEVIATSVSFQAEEKMEETTAVNTDAHEEVEKQLLDSEVRLSTVVDGSSATPPCEISADTVDEPEERSMPVQEKMPELLAYHSEREEMDEWQRQTAAETAGESFSPTSTVAEEASLLIQNENVHNTGEAEEVGPTVGKTVSINDESNVPYTVEDQIHDSSEESVGRYEVAPLKEEQEEEKTVPLGTDEGLEDTHFKPVSEPQPNEVTKGQSGWEVHEDVSPGIKVVSDLETNEVIDTSFRIQADENIEEMTAIDTDAHEEVEEQLLEMRLSTVVGESSATPPCEISADIVDEPEERSMPVQEKMPELPVNHSEEEETDKWPAKTGNVDVDAKPLLHTVGTIVTTHEEEDLSLISVSEEIMQVEVKGLTVLSIAPKDFSQKEDVDQQNVTAGSGIDNGQAKSDGDSISDGEKEGIVVEEAVSKKITFCDQDGGTKLIIGRNITDEKKDEAGPEEMVSQVQQNFDFSNEQDKESAKVDTLCTSPQVDNNLVSPNEEEIVEVVALTVQQNINITDNQEEVIETETALGKSPPLEDELILDDKLRDGVNEDGIVEEEVSSVQQLSGVTGDEDSKEDNTAHAGPQVEDDLISDDNVSDEEKEVLSIQQKKYISEREDALGTSLQSPLQQHGSVPDDQHVESAKETTSITSSHQGEEGTKTYQTPNNQTLSLESECLERTTSKFAETEEIPFEVTTDPRRKEVDSSLISDITLDIPERQDMVDQELVGDADMEGLNNVVTSSENLKSFRVATGQVSRSREDTEATGSIFAYGLLHEGETVWPENQNTDVISTGESEGSHLFLEKGKAEGTFDTELEEGLDHARGRVSPTFCAELKGVDKTLSAVLQKDPGSAATGGASFTPTTVAEEATYLVQNESAHVTGEEAAVGPAAGEAGSINVEPKVLYDKHESKACGDQVSRTPRNKSSKSKMDSNKSHSKSPSDKCKQQ